MKILVLEDNERLNKFITSVFMKKGYEVDAFMDGAQALEVLKDGYDCFILDINVPRVDGITILKTIRESDANAVVIVVSSNLQPDNLELISTLQKTDYLKKPFFMDDLIEKVNFLSL